MPGCALCIPPTVAPHPSWTVCLALCHWRPRSAAAQHVCVHVVCGCGCARQDREADLVHLVARVEGGAAPGGPLCGTIPNHLRRRTRSHARIQMPLKLRLKPLVRLSTGLRCRKHRRVASRLRAGWAAALPGGLHSGTPKGSLSSGKVEGASAAVGKAKALGQQCPAKSGAGGGSGAGSDNSGCSGVGLRLPTHMWCVKRLHMDTLWGFRIGTSAMDKGARAVYRVSHLGWRPTNHSFLACAPPQGTEVLKSALLRLPTAFPS